MGTSSELKAMIPSKNILSLKLDKLDEALARKAATLPGVSSAKLADGFQQYA